MKYSPTFLSGAMPNHCRLGLQVSSESRSAVVAAFRSSVVRPSRSGVWAILHGDIDIRPALPEIS